MNRRSMLGSAAAAAASFGATVGGRALAAAANTRDKTPMPGFVRTQDGVDLFYRDWGTGRPVVFIAGWILPSDSWAYQMAPLAGAGIRCIAYDRRGHGRSSDPGHGYDFDTLADDLATVLETLDLRDVTLVSHSMGCTEVTRYLARHGTDRVARVAFAATDTPCLVRAPDNPNGIDQAVFDRFRQTLLSDLPGWLDNNARPFVLPDTSQATLEWLKGLALKTSLQAALDCQRSLERADSRAELRAMRLPMLIIHGDADVSAPLDLTGRWTAKLVPGARLVVYQGAPHGLFITHRERLNADLRAFASV